MTMDWNDLQTVEALVRLGTLDGAARALGLTHSTVSRRLAAIEAKVATSLFVRGARLSPTPLAQQLAAEAARCAPRSGHRPCADPPNEVTALVPAADIDRAEACRS